MERVLENPVTGERTAFREATDAALRFGCALELGGLAVGRVDHPHPNRKERSAVRWDDTASGSTATSGRLAGNPARYERDGESA